MTSPFTTGPAAPPPPPVRRRGPGFGIAVAVAVLVLAVVVVVTIQAVHRQSRTGFATSTLPGGTTTTGVGSATTPPTVAPGGGSAVVTSACPPVAQAFPLPDRTCTIVSPPNVQPGEKLPVVFVLHGFNTTAARERSIGQWDDAVVRDRFIAVFPQGDFNSWNAGRCCGLAKSGGIDDVGYLQTLVSAARARSDVDPAKVFMVGESNGGMMTYRFLCDHADELAGAASVEGTSVAGCEPNAAVRFLHVHGRDDTTVPYEGGQSLISWVLGVTFTTVEQSVQGVATAEGCGPSTTTTAGKVTTETWQGCGSGGPVQLVSLAGWGHVWPRGIYDATTQILQYFGVAS